jgi:hypothetical protein
VFHLCSTADDNGPYYGDLKFPFEKGTVPTADQAMAGVAEVLSAEAQTQSDSTQQASQTNPPQQPQAPAPPPPPPPPPPVALKLPATYVNAQTQEDKIQLNADGSLSLREGGETSRGTFAVNGNTLEIKIVGIDTKIMATLQDNSLTDSNGQSWVLGQPSAPPPPPPPPPPVTLKLPATYVSAQKQADQIQLKADGSFSLREGGETSRGKFAVNGNTLEFKIVGTDTKITATLQGNSLTDGNGQTWVLGEQPVRTAPTEPPLHNEDVIKLAKAGFKDATILKKIGSSSCQFDTSTDALTQLKKSGVSEAVVEAMMDAK